MRPEELRQLAHDFLEKHRASAEPPPDLEAELAGLLAFVYQRGGLHMADRLGMFERYIHINECQGEGGYFAFFTPDGVMDDRLFDQRVNGRVTEEEALARLVKLAAAALLAK